MSRRFQNGAGRERLALVAGVLALGLLGLVVFSVSGAGDYGVTRPVAGDNAAPGIEALLHGSVAGYLAHQPLIGLTTILLRLPLAALGSALGGDDLMIYKFGALACMLPLALAAAWLIAAPGLPLRLRLLRLLTVVAVIQSPILRAAVQTGHPEDLVAAVLATASVVAATRGHARWAAVLLGLSIGEKEWAVIAVVPVMIALPGRRREVGAIAAALVVLLSGIVWLGDPAAFEQALHAERAMFLSPVSLLWPIATPVHLAGGGYLKVARPIPWGLTRTGASSAQLAAAAVLGGAWYLRVRRRGASCNPICLLALLGAMRCICDTQALPYYWLAMLIPVATWESTENRVPVATLCLSLMVWVLFGAMGHVPSNLVYAASVAAEAGLIVYLARQAVAPNRGAEDRMLQLGAPTRPRISQAAQRMYSRSLRKLGLEPR
jgi:hypothetical protein